MNIFQTLLYNCVQVESNVSKLLFKLRASRRRPAAVGCRCQRTCVREPRVKGMGGGAGRCDGQQHRQPPAGSCGQGPRPWRSRSPTHPRAGGPSCCSSCHQASGFLSQVGPLAWRCGGVSSADGAQVNRPFPFFCCELQFLFSSRVGNTSSWVSEIRRTPTG